MNIPQNFVDTPLVRYQHLWPGGAVLTRVGRVSPAPLVRLSSQAQEPGASPAPSLGGQLNTTVPAELTVAPSISSSGRIGARSSQGGAVGFFTVMVDDAAKEAPV